MARRLAENADVSVLVAPNLYRRDGPRRDVGRRRQSEAIRNRTPSHRRWFDHAPDNDRQYHVPLRHHRRARIRGPSQTPRALSRPTGPDNSPRTPRTHARPHCWLSAQRSSWRRYRTTAASTIDPHLVHTILSQHTSYHHCRPQSARLAVEACRNQVGAHIRQLGFG